MFCHPDQFSQHCRILSEAHAALGGVWAGDVQLVGGDSFARIEDVNRLFVVVDGIAEDVGDDHDVGNLLEDGKLFFEEGARPDVLQSDGIEHSSRSFPQARRRIARHGLARKALDDETTELVEGNHVLKFNAVTESAGCSHDGVLQRYAGKAGAHVQRHRRAARRTRRR